MKSRLILIGFLFSITACTHSLHLSHVSDFSPTYKPYEAGTLVKSRAEQFTFMGFVTETNYVDFALQQLKNACPKGKIQGITTQYSTNHGFFSWTNVIEMQGLCIN
jgi:hypothetical protein